MKSIAVSFVLAFALAFAIVSFLLSPARADERMDAALVTAAMSVFVDETCPGLTPDMAMMRARFDDLGVTQAQVMAPNRLRQAQLYLINFRRDPKAACRLIRQNFGPDGEKIPGLFKAE